MTSSHFSFSTALIDINILEILINITVFFFSTVQFSWETASLLYFTMTSWMCEAEEWQHTCDGEDTTFSPCTRSHSTYLLADHRLGSLHRVPVRSYCTGFVYSPLPAPLFSVTVVDMQSQLRDVAMTRPVGAGQPAVPITNTSISSSPTPGTDTRGCENGALMDSFGIFLQGLLAVMAFSTLMCKYDWRFAVCQISDTSCWSHVGSPLTNCIT